MHHILGVLRGVCIHRVDELSPIMEQVIKELNLTEVKRAFHQFEPHGATGVIVLSESHFSAHTYPEDESVYFDLFCCSPTFNSTVACECITRVFKAQMFDYKYIPR